VRAWGAWGVLGTSQRTRAVSARLGRGRQRRKRPQPFDRARPLHLPLPPPPPVTVDAFFSILTSFVAALRRAQAENADEEARRARELRRQAGSIRGGGGALATPSAGAAVMPPLSTQARGGASETPALGPGLSAQTPAAAPGGASETPGVGASAYPPAPPRAGTAPRLPPARPAAEDAAPGGRPNLASLLAGRSQLKARPPPPPALPPVSAASLESLPDALSQSRAISLGASEAAPPAPTAVSEAAVPPSGVGERPSMSSLLAGRAMLKSRAQGGDAVAQRPPAAQFAEASVAAPPLRRLEF